MTLKINDIDDHTFAAKILVKRHIFAKKILVKRHKSQKKILVKRHISYLLDFPNDEVKNRFVTMVANNYLTPAGNFSSKTGTIDDWKVEK